MVVICPKCTIKLKVDETKLSPAGSKFKCPKCAAVLVVRRPAAKQEKKLDSSTILLGHTNAVLVKEIVSILTAAGYKVITAADGIELMVKALKELPFLAIIEVALPKIYGFEVCRRVKSRGETKDMRFILIPATHDKTKYRREPTSLYGADDYIEEFDVASQLLEKINRLLGRGADDAGLTHSGGSDPAQTMGTKTATEMPISSAAQQPATSGVSGAGLKTEAQAQAPSAPKTDTDEKVEKARRLARTIVNDIDLYNVSKVKESISAGNFYTVFASELKEGKKLYDSRIPQEIRDKLDYYKEAIDNFIALRKKS